MSNATARAAAEARFRERVAELGGQVLGEYKRGDQRVRCRCPAGHKCSPFPAGLRQGREMCAVCTRRDPVTAERAFRLRVADLGGQVLGEYRGNNTPVLCACPEGHSCKPRPAGLLRGKGLCLACAGNDPVIAEQEFRERVAALGGQVLGGYLYAHKGVRCMCPAGHDCEPSPANLRKGRGMCAVCTRRDPVTAERAFRLRVADLGGQVLGEYRGYNTPVSCVCPEGHSCKPRPAALLRGGMCRTCAGKDPAATEYTFRERVAALGGQVLGEYKSSDTGVACRCAAGHECNPRPHGLLRGEGMCLACAGRDWDIYYVVTAPGTGHVKAGITSGDPRPRLRTHARYGYTQVELLVTDVPDARDLERNVLQALRDSGIKPHRGREWFPEDALPVILDIAGNWPVPSKDTAEVAA